MSDFTRRKRDHDYQAPCTYHIVFSKNDSIGDFGSLRTHPHKSPGDDKYSFIYYSPLGHIILKAIYEIHLHQPLITISQYCVMPDHVHLLIRVTDRIPKHLGFYLGQFSGNVTRKWRLYNDGDNAIPSIFAPNYTDKPIYNKTRYEIAKKYVKDNPYRLAMRKLHPEFFRKVRALTIGGEPFQAYGNLFHLRNPFISQVIVHRANSPEENENLFSEWLEEVEKEGVLVSPFISHLEKEMRKQAIGKGGRIIHIRKDAFGERFKPSGADFELCAKGQLLIIAPVETMGEELTKEICGKMNKTAEEIAKGNFRIG